MKHHAHPDVWLRYEAAKRASCEDSFPIVCMDFDHRPGETKVRSVSSLVHQGKPWIVVKREIDKCDLVCANCHRIRTWMLREGHHPKSKGRPVGPHRPRDGNVTSKDIARELGWTYQKLRRELRVINVVRGENDPWLSWTREDAERLKRILLIDG